MNTSTETAVFSPLDNLLLFTDLLKTHQDHFLKPLCHFDILYFNILPISKLLLAICY